jgi:hypothetical protein
MMLDCRYQKRESRKMGSRFLILGVIALVLSGCGDPKIDGSSESALKESLAKIGKSLPAEKQDQFKQSLGLIAVSQMDVGSVLSGKKSADGLFDEARKGLDGKTADQVIAQAVQIRLDREQRERTQALAEIQELLAKRAAAESAVLELKKFTVTKSRFEIVPQKYSSQGQPEIHIAVANDTAHPISRAYFRGTIASPGRSVPWFTDTFNYQIAGGLEAGEKAEWVLLPNQFSNWGKVNTPADAVFTVEVVRLDGPDNKALFNAEGFTNTNQTRLLELQKKYSGS